MGYVNLMSPAAQVREIRRTRIRQWTVVLAVAAVLLIPAAICSWWPVYQARKQIAALEMEYEPTRQLIAETLRLRKQIDQTRRRGKLALALERQMPLLTLLGLIGEAVAETDQRVVLEAVNFQQNPSPWVQLNSTTLKLSGVGQSGQATAELTDALRQRLPAASVDIQDARSVAKQGQLRSEFTIHAGLP